MKFDRQGFFKSYREQLGVITEVEVQNLNQILDHAEPDDRANSLRQLAYMIATARWETRRFERLREVGGHNYLSQYDGKGGNRPGTDDYYDFRGGGWCHTTFRDNYRKATAWCKAKGISVDLEKTPEDILRPDVNYEVMITGHLTGGFTGFKLGTYVNNQTADYRGARVVINPVELYIADGKRKATPKRKAQCIEAVDTIVRWSKAIEAALRAADKDGLPITTVVENNEPTEDFEPKTAIGEVIKPQFLETAKGEAGTMAKTAMSGLSFSTIVSWFAQNRWLTAAVFFIVLLGFAIVFRRTLRLLLAKVIGIFGRGL